MSDDDLYPPDEDYGPQPPQDLAAEQAALGGMMMAKGAVSAVSKLVGVHDFYRPNHAVIYQSIMDLVAAGIEVDAVSVGAELDNRGQLTKIGGAPYLLDILANTPSAANAGYYAKIIAAKARLRRMGELGDQLKSLAYSDTSDVGDINELLSVGEQMFRTEHEPDDRALTFDQLIKSWETWQEKGESAIRTPWDQLNNRLNGGLQRGRLYTIGARPGVGKSVMSLNVASFAAWLGYTPVLFTLEMSADEVTSRMIAAGASADLGQVLGKRMDLQTREKVDRYIQENRDLSLQVVDREYLTVEQIVAHCRSLAKKDVVVVDYLQLMGASDKKAPREQQVSHMSRSLKIAARELNVAMVVCSQLNRGPLNNGKVRAPNIGDLRESGAIEQDSDCVILLHSDEDDPGIIQMIIGKNRQGKTGDLVLNFEGRYARIT